MARILIVDDDPTTVFLLRVALEESGHEVVAEDDPERVLEVARAERPEAVVLDVVLPGRSGFELLEDLRGDPATRHLPILMLTSLGEGSHRVDGLRGGADDYLVKPFEPAELVLRLERMVARAPKAERIREPSVEDILTSLGRRTRRLEELGHDGRAEDAEDAEDTERKLPTVLLGRYEVFEVLAEGGMGILFRGWDPLLRRKVALKTVRIDRRQQHGIGVDDPAELLLREGVLGARVAHPNLVTVLDVGLLRDAAFLAMELVEGSNLAAFVDRERRLPARRAVPILASVAWGLDAAHRAGVIHRDIKLENVLLGRGGSVKVTDFGLAALVTSLAGSDGEIFGTPGYIAPEVLSGEGYDARADVFALGVVAYSLLSGSMPFQGETMPAVLTKTLLRHPPPLIEVSDEVPAAVSDLVARMIAKTPEERPAAGEAAEVFEGCCAEEGWRWSPDELPEPILGLETVSQLVHSSWRTRVEGLSNGS